MASSSGPRWRLACDACDASAWVGATAHGFDVWCEACQLAQSLPAVPVTHGASASCTRCGTPLAASPRFLELWGILQQLDAVLAAWAGDPVPLATLLPERPVFLTDLTPPVARDGDPEPLRAQLAALARGDWRAVLAAPGPAMGPDAPGEGRSSTAARAIAHERMGDPAAAIAAWGAVLAAGDDPRARLARGSLLARAGRYEESARDLDRAGGSFAARWSRAALRITSAVRTNGGMPDRETLERARAEAGAPSAYWSDPTVGRLLWTLLLARIGPGGTKRASEQERALLRAAEAELEHESFWDRSLVLVGWARVGAADEAARVAQPLARAEAERLAREPALAGERLRDVSRALAHATAAIDAGAPARAREALAAALAREDLQRFRLPCARCGRGTIGVDEVLEASADEG